MTIIRICVYPVARITGHRVKPMYVCICNAVSERAIREAVEGGVRTFDELRTQTGCATSCGCCEAVAIQVMEQCLRGTGPARPPSHPPRYHTLATDSVG